MNKVYRYTILAVDDAKDSLLLLEHDLKEAGYQVLTAESGDEALSILQEKNVSLILLDMHMPGISGLTVLQAVKAQKDIEHVPVVMLSASDDETQIVASLEFGADDYVTKPYIPNVLLARIRNSLRLMEKTLQLESLASIDFLTKVNNRGSFQNLVEKVISQAKRDQSIVSMAMFDLDFFKHVNDTYGHEIGDKALISFAQILKDTFRDYDIIGRVGGEEFAVCMPNADIEAVFNACERCRKTLEAHVIYFEYEGKECQLSLSVSVGVTSAQGQVIDFDELLRISDHALYKAKKNGRNQTMIEGEFDLNITTIESKKRQEQEKKNMQEKYAGINYQVGLNNVLGDESLFEDILVMFHQDHGEDHNNIQQAIDENDQRRLKHLVHTIKGVSCSIGAMTLYDLCKELDVAVNENNTSSYQALFTPLKAELIKVTSGIALHLSEKL
ncbi:diguanylate cyclase [Colwellia sp. 1_MG-2023]|uniref:diguanylate cyclase n=1 Tax=Colwellia sp. 1_MG-2023 TaxID=3062649 RepID=UPI0026E3A78E|nr:diguanylate cyclase [Colwellia sp. 1_MG-2023]MDO6446080.1 diguanylate cyclase [Colwellia sp. 1_MG-2023]